MYIKQIDIDNFKSFATSVEIPLLKGFSTIVGPNGSGKSNIIDAVLFALGLAKSRALRGEKLEDFVSNHTKRTEAFVRVTFTECGEDPEFSVARRIKKTSQGYISTYYLDDKITTHTDILIKLEKYNVTPNSYNVVMQGDITSIVNCSDNDRRKIIDEIAGVADFDRQISQASEKLDKVEESVKLSTNILNEVQTRLEQLKEEKEVALKYKKLKDDKTNLEGQVTTVRFFDIKNKLEQAHSNILEFTKKKKIEADNEKDLAERIKVIDEEYQQICKTVQEKGEAHQLEVQQQAEECKGEISRKETAISFEEKQIQLNEKTIVNSHNGIENNKNKIESFEQSIKSKEADIKVIDEQLKEKKAEKQRITENLTGVSENVELQIQKREDLRKQLDTLRDKENALLQKQSPLEADLKTIQSKLSDANKNIENYNNLKSEFDSKEDKLKLQIEQLKTEQADFQIIQQNVMHDLDKTSNELTDLEFDISAARKQIFKLEANRQANESSNTNRNLQIIKNAKLSGVHAPLYKLGNVDKEYSTALEVAVGGRMANIVVDDPGVARSVFEIVRSSNGGRVTCLPLNKLKKAPSSLNLPKDKGVIDYAINLIDFDDIYLDAFFYVVQDTLIVEDSIIAEKLQGKYRMVTLDGTLYEKAGAMTGGGKINSGLKFNSNEDTEIDKYTKRLKDLEDKYNSTKQKQKDLEEKRDKIRTDYSNTTTELNKANIELNSLRSNFESLKTNYAQYQEYVKLSEPEINKLNKELDKLEQERVNLFDEMGTLKSQIDEIEQLLDDSDLKKLKDLTKDIDAEIERLESNKRNCENEIQSDNMQIAFHKTTIENMTETIEKCETSIVESKDKKKIFEEEIVGLQEKLKIYLDQIEEIKLKLGDLLTKRDEINNQLVDLRTKHNLKQKEVEDITEQIESFKARRREIEPELETAKHDLEEAGVDIEKLQPVTISIDELNNKIQRLSKRMDDLGAVNMRAIEDYEKVEEREKDLKDQIDDLTREREGLIERMHGYEQLKKDAFLSTYNSINSNFKEIYHQLSGGEGSLLIDNERDPFAGGMTIEAKPGDKPKCKLKGLSGGEQSVASAALVFAIQKHLPAPFYALDEVDQALDEMNVGKLADMINIQAKQIQFIVVTHKQSMIRVSDRAIGVTHKGKGISLVSAVSLKNAEQMTEGSKKEVLSV